LTHQIALHSAPTYWRCEPGWSWQSKPLPDHLLWCVLDGVGRLELDGRSADLEPGVCAVFRPGDAPVAEHDPHRRLLVFGLHFAATDQDHLPPGRWCAVRDQPLLAALARRCDDGYRRGDALGPRQVRASLDLILLMLYDDAVRPAPAGVDAALEDIVREIRRDPIRRWTVPGLAAEVGLSRAQLTRRFTAHTGLPPARFVAQTRILRARELLAETNLTVTQVATVLGYTDLAHFSRQFKHHTGHPPRTTQS
jgi:AraC family transcriptional regulator, arabinose operon regulatory protein